MINEEKIWAQRLSYVGELGWELFIPLEIANKIYKTITQTGKKFDLAHAGTHTMDILRMEKGYLHWGHDISPEENQYESGLKFTISYSKNVNFIGRDSLIKIKDKKPSKQFLMFALKDSKPGDPLMLHEEPIYLEDKIIGRTTSGNYSFCFDKNLTFGYVKTKHSMAELKTMNLFVEVEKKKYPIYILSKPLIDKKKRLN